MNTKVILKWEVEKTTSLPDSVKRRLLAKQKRRISKTGEMTLTSHRFRDQGRNVADVLNKLREIVLEVEKEPKKRKPVKISKAAKRRRLENKKRNSEKKRLRSKQPKMND